MSYRGTPTIHYLQKIARSGAQRTEIEDAIDCERIFGLTSGPHQRSHHSRLHGAFHFQLPCTSLYPDCSGPRSCWTTGRLQPNVLKDALDSSRLPHCGAASVRQSARFLPVVFVVESRCRRACILPTCLLDQRHDGPGDGSRSRILEPFRTM